MTQVLPEKQMSEAFINSIFLCNVRRLSGCIHLLYQRQGVLQRADGQCGVDEPAFYDGRVEGRAEVSVAASGIRVWRAGGGTDTGAVPFCQGLHWRQGILLLEIAILLIVGFLPQTLNMTATILVSFACAMQVQSFRKVHGYPFASTMCIGNLRSGTASLSMYFRERRPEFLKQALYYFGIILFFALGAGAGGNLSVRYGVHVIWVSGGLLMVSVLLMFLEKLRAWNR